MELIRWFDKLHKNDTLIAGGKGASLGELTQAGIPVPPGFVILSSAFDRFLEKAKLNQELDAFFDTLDYHEMHTVELASEKIQSLIKGAMMPEEIAQAIQEEYAKLGAEFVAVRSSATAEDGATAAWAGQLETYLNTTEEHVLENVQRCWASLFTPRAIFYRFEKGMHGSKISVAVVVQKMVQSEVSGIAFSVHPVTDDRNQLIIEAGFGLGESIVSGQVTPDSFVVEKEPRQIIDKNITYQSRALWRAANGGNEWRDLSQTEGEKPALTDAQVLDLAELVLTIEKHYGFPCDVEWTFEAGHFYITQSRPITTLPANAIAREEILKKEFSRDFTMIALQMDYVCESRPERPWTIGPNPHRPYLAFWHDDGTTKIYFNAGGMRWFQEQLRSRILEDADFLVTVERNVRNGIRIIQPIYSARQTLGRKDLIAFVESFIAAYHWIEAMWLIKAMVDDGFSSVDCANIIALRKETEELSAATDEVIRVSLQKLYPELGRLSAMITLEELKDGIPPDTDTLLKRDQGFVLFENSIHTGVALGDFAEAHGFRIAFEQVANTSSIQGEIAYGGLYRGRVSRIMGHSDFDKINPGDVLVSPMTMADFLPLMKQAGAFVTDEGGLLCHAAIVAREMKKPCVIGTKIATEVFKDGDTVEVNATTGVVRKI